MGTVAILSLMAFAAFTWWFATGLILCLGRRPDDWHSTVLLSLTIPAGLAVICAWGVADDPTVIGALGGFVSAVALWGWHEAAFLLGYSAGPRRIPCPPGTGAARRFRLAFAAMRDHELALLATVVALALLLWNAPNRVALDTFIVLWLCRIASKLCIFEGVPAMAHEMMPQRLAYLKSYFGEGRPRTAFAFAITGLALATAWMIGLAVKAEAAFEAASAVLIATLIGLALLEHLFLVLPVRDGKLWMWATRTSGAAEAPHPVPRAALEGAGLGRMSGPAHRRRLQGVALEGRAVAPRKRGI